MKTTFRAFWILLLVAVLGMPAAVMADATSAAYVASGRAKIFGSGNPTYSGILAAKADFEAAVAADPTDAEAHFFLAVCKAAEFALLNGSGAGLETAMDLANAFGILRNANDSLDDLPIDDPPELYGYYNAPTTVPDGDALQAFLVDRTLPLVDALIAHMSVPGAGFAVTLSAAETGDAEVEIDYSDARVILSSLYAVKSFIHLVDAYTMTADIREIMVRGNADVLRMQRDIIDANPGFFALKGAGESTPAMAASKAAIDASITTFRQAFDAVAGEVDGQDNDLFFFATPEEQQDAESFLINAEAFQAAMNSDGNADIVQEQNRYWDFWDAAMENQFAISLSYNAAGGVTGGRAYGMPNMNEFGNQCLFFVCEGFNVNLLEETGSQLRLYINGFGGPNGYYREAQFTINKADASGVFTGTEWGMSGPVPLNGAFTQGPSGSYPLVSERKQVVYPNAVFGNGAGVGPFPGRDALPVFGMYSQPGANTFPGDPILNGFFPGRANNQQAANDPEWDLRFMTADNRNHFSIPAAGAMAMDGQMDDWAGLTPLVTDFTGDTDPYASCSFSGNIPQPCTGSEGDDLGRVWVAKDATYLYVGMELMNGSPLAVPTMGYVLNFTYGYGDDDYGGFVGAWYEDRGAGAQWYAVTRRRTGPGIEPQEIGTVTQDVGTGTGFIEFRIPLADLAGDAGINGVEGKWVQAYSHLTGGWMDGPPNPILNDNAPTQIKLDPAVLTASVDCSGCTAGNIFVYAVSLDGRYGLGETIADAANGNAFTLAVGGTPGTDFIVKTFYDADNNGIRTFGDFQGMDTTVQTADPLLPALSQGSPLATSEIGNDTMMTKPGVYRVFGSNDFNMPDPAYYFGPWDANEVDWAQGGTATWTYLGEAAATADFPTAGKYFRYILIMYSDGDRFRFDAVTADAGVYGVAFGFKNRQPAPDPWAGPDLVTERDFDARWIHSGIRPYDHNGWGGAFIMGAPDGVYDYNDGGDGFILLKMPGESYDGYDSGSGAGVYTPIGADGSATTLSVAIAGADLLPPVLYDDFSGGFNPEKWQQSFAGRYVDGGAGVLRLDSGADNGYSRTRLHFKDPGGITALSTDMKVDWANADTNGNGTFAFAQIQGFFYRNTVGDPGDVVAAVMLRQIDGALQPYWEIGKWLDSQNWVTLSNGVFTQTAPAVGSWYTAAIQWDGGTGFSLTFNGETVTPTGPANEGPPTLDNKDLTAGVQSDNEYGWGGINAVFDNVMTGTGGGALAAYDDFSTSPINQANWVEGEFNRYTDNQTGELVMGVYSPDGEREQVELRATRVSPYVGVDIMARSGEMYIPDGMRGHAQLNGILYNDSRDGDAVPYEGMIGDVYGGVYLETRDRGTANSQEYSLRCYVERVADADFTVSTPMFFHQFPIQVFPDHPYRVSMRLTANAIVFTAADKWTGAQASVTYPISTPIYPASNEFRRLRTRIENKYSAPVPEGGLTGRFDNVMVDPALRFNAIAKYVHTLDDSGADKYMMFYEWEIPAGGYHGTMPDGLTNVHIQLPDGSSIDFDPASTGGADDCYFINYSDGSGYGGCTPVVASPPAAGTYTYTITTAEGLTATSVVQRDEAVSIPIVDTTQVVPADGTFQFNNYFYVPEVPTPPGIDQLCYRLQIYGTDGLTRYTSGRQPYPADGRFTIPAGKLVPGQHYRLRVRVTDACNYLEIQNRSHNWPSVAFTAFGGDIDGSGAVTIDDAVKGLKGIVGGDTTGFNYTYGDVNGDGKIGYEDIVFVLQALSGSR